ncbi:MAG: hypothetical protein ACK5P6_12145 [Pseudobdellovibrionaceae bacterium]|jgi:hypothetical protein|nr:hypothetical protein [Pseudomonadota bacterium]
MIKLKPEAQKVFLGIALIALVVSAVMTQEQKLNESRPFYMVSDSPDRLKDLNRAIASAQPMNLIEDVEWEHRLAQKLGKENSLEARNPASQSRGLSSADQLRYGTLAGKYSIVHKLDEQTKDQKIFQIEYVTSSELNDRPVFLEPSEFLSDFKAHFAISFASFKLESEKAGQLVFQLQDQNQKSVGQAIFDTNDEGRFLKMRLSESK